MTELTTIDAHVQSVLVGLSREPRGHAGVVSVVLAEPDRADADAGLLFFTPQGALPLCGHAVMGATALALSRSLLTSRQPALVQYDTVAGPVTARLPGPPGATGAVRVRYTGPPSGVLRGNVPVTVGRRSLRSDLAWSGSELVAIVDAEAAGVPLVSSRVLELQRAGLEVAAHLEEAVRVPHPQTGDRLPVSSIVFIGPAPESGVDVRSGSVFVDGTVERSPGAGATSAIAAVLAAMGLLMPGRRLVHQGLLGTTLWATIAAMFERDGRHLVEVEIDGEAWLTGEHVFRFDPMDPLVDGAVWA
jgi:proline racemase